MKTRSANQYRNKTKENIIISLYINSNYLHCKTAKITIIVAAAAGEEGRTEINKQIREKKSKLNPLKVRKCKDLLCTHIVLFLFQWA